ncbi:ABC transporter [Bradyrhizobium neotropicale]|nr:ABC transporter [Bradyrhizobium neotropicale]
MAGLDPAIHVLSPCTEAKNVDARDKPGHDDIVSFARFSLGQST